MSRSGYYDDCDNDWSLIMWRGAVNSALRGRRGQAFLREMLAALDALPFKRLVADDLAKPDRFRLSCSHWGMHLCETESVCAIGAVGRQRGIDMHGLDPDDADTVSGRFGIAPAMVREIVYENDEGYYRETPEHRYERMRAWTLSHLDRRDQLGKVRYPAEEYPL